MKMKRSGKYCDEFFFEIGFNQKMMWNISRSLSFIIDSSVNTCDVVPDEGQDLAKTIIVGALKPVQELDSHVVKSQSGMLR